MTSAIKTVLWTYCLCRITGIDGPYGLERRFEPEAFWRGEEGDRFHINKWPGYAKGMHEPRRVLAAVEGAYPGANACLRSPLWSALAPNSMPKGQIRKLLAQLQTPLQDLIKRHGFWPETAKSDRRRNTETLAAAIERRASLDALAAVILLLRLAHAKGDHDGAYDWGGRVWRMMVLLGPALVDGGIARPLSELIDERVMPMASLQGIRLGFPAGGYMMVVAAFRAARARVARQSLTEQATGWQRQAIGPRLLAYKLGWDFLHAFNPIPMLDDGADLLGLSGRAVHTARGAEEHRWCHEWALNMLTRGGHQNPPPDAVLKGKDLWAVDPDDPIELQRAQFRKQRRAA